MVPVVVAGCVASWFISRRMRAAARERELERQAQEALTVALRKKIAELEQQIPNYRREASGASGASAGPSDEAASQDAEAVDLQDAAAAAVQHDDQDQVCGDPENVERPSKDLDKLGTDFERLRQVLRSSRR
eukprot:CAMPEP_0198723670 /NCGR_PEP_ID=MMETSP1475-20131203/1197_1 /TAXON_ID= ORGANISM="Unidentified sp., Strain CCMP1999" /NCGR_SAMPLE_ID=MMETSP1475 /ASSEMBLY_ACC=CAM_ASM_001111 /LENGTH=131 /DNA_ID=CAMNT_0044484917 /DNA_START=262 /DNA_END=657 /DNA_ORIENTATION=-